MSQEYYQDGSFWSAEDVDSQPPAYRSVADLEKQQNLARERVAAMPILRPALDTFRESVSSYPCVVCGEHIYVGRLCIPDRFAMSQLLTEDTAAIMNTADDMALDAARKRAEAAQDTDSWDQDTPLSVVKAVLQKKRVIKRKKLDD